MATKEEHLAELIRDRLEREKSDSAAMLWRTEETTAQALAERDAAREEIKILGDVISNLKAAQPAAEAPSPEPAAPEGPFRAFGFLYVKRGAEPAIGCMDTPQRDEVLRLLNAGLEAEKLRARVAELEESQGVGVLAMLKRAIDAEARADAAEAKLAALGENPIRRELVERWKRAATRIETTEILCALLAGRGPEVAS